MAIFALAVGIGTAAGSYGIARALLADLRGVPNVDRLGRVYAASSSLGVGRSPVALSEFDSPLSSSAAFSAIGAYADEDAAFGKGLDARPIVAGYASPGFFRAMGVPPAAGRVFTDEDVPGRPVAILSDALWRRQFPDGRLADAVVVVDGVERQVIGVMPPEFRYGFIGVRADVWIPLARASFAMPAIVSVFARLRDDVEWPAAQAELASLSRARGGVARATSQWTWHAVPLTNDTRTRALAAYAGTFGPAFLLLLFACMNVACLLLARGIARDTELSVRQALGASRARLVRLLLIENLVLALVGGTLGGVLAFAALRMVVSALGAFQPALTSAIAADERLIPAACVASGVACALFGALPALRHSKRRLAGSLIGASAVQPPDVAGYGVRDVIVFAEVAVAVSFLVWTAMVYTLFAQLEAIRIAFPADRVVAMRVPVSSVDMVAARVARVPGVARTAVSSGMLGGGTPERVERPGTRPATLSRIPIGDGFLDTLGLPLVRGRVFDAAELRTHAAVAVLSESGARLLAPGVDPIGLRLRTTGRGDILIVGVCRDAIDYGALTQADSAAPEMYVPYEVSVTSAEAIVLARMAGDAHAALPAIAAAAGVPEGARPARPIVLSDDFGTRPRDGGIVVVRALQVFSWFTLLLAATGAFAVISQSVAQRKRELAIHMAIGATRWRVLRMVLARESKLIGAAVATGLAFTMLATRAVFVELARLNAIAPSRWMSALLLSVAIAAVAALFATYRIVRVEPAAVLRRL